MSTESGFESVPFDAGDFRFAGGGVQLLTNTPNLVGFWESPMYPEHSEGKDLPNPRDWVDRDWDAAERAKIIDYLESGTVYTRFFGYSYCRMGCERNEREMGSCDLTDGVWIYPQGYSHYLRCHDVKPPNEFIAHIRENEFTQPLLAGVPLQTNGNDVPVESNLEQVKPRLSEEEIQDIVEEATQRKIRVYKNPWWKFW